MADTRMFTESAPNHLMALQAALGVPAGAPEQQQEMGELEQIAAESSDDEPIALADWSHNSAASYAKHEMAEKQERHLAL